MSTIHSYLPKILDKVSEIKPNNDTEKTFVEAIAAETNMAHEALSRGDVLLAHTRLNLAKLALDELTSARKNHTIVK